MGIITKILKQTDNKFLNLYKLERENETGKLNDYFMASRVMEIENLKIHTHDEHADGIIIYALYEDKIVLIRQFRYPLNAYVYEFPAGLVDEGEDMFHAGVREFKEETGLELEVLKVPDGFNRPFYMSVGMTDEACGTIYGYASGKISDALQENSEEIEIILADKQEARRILREENVAIVCAYMLMHYINSDDPFAFLKEA
ncbi:MAG: NUDIX hydrolase [Lachnospiraceae bacterium]